MAKQERAVRTRETVLVAAGEAFAENGFLGTSMADILQRAGVTKGALYFHFASKEELAFAVIEEEETAATRIAEEELARNARPLEVAVAVTTRWAHEIQTNPVIRAGVRLIIEQGTYDRPMPQPYGQWEQLLIDLLSRAGERGELAEGVDPEAAAGLIVSAFTGAQVVSQVSTGHKDLPQRVEAMWQLLFTGLLPKGHKVLFLPRISS